MPPIVEGQSDLIVGPLTAAPDPARARGRPIVTQFTCTNAASDSSGSKYLLASLPSDCILSPQTWFKVDQAGFAAIRIGTATDVDALVAVLKSAGTYVEPLTRGGASHGKPLWEVLGLAADPGGFIGIYWHAIADATGAGTLQGAFHYFYR